MISNRRSARRIVVELLSLSPFNGNTRLIIGCTSSQQSVSRHREKDGEVDRSSRDQRRIRVVGKIRRGVGEMLYVDEVEEERPAYNRKDRRENFALQRDRNQKYQRVVEISLMHSRREHEEAEQRDENREQHTASRPRAPDQVRRDQVNDAGNRKAERAVCNA